MSLISFLLVLLAAAIQALWNFWTKRFNGKRLLLLVVGWGGAGLVLTPLGFYFQGEDVSAHGFSIVLLSGIVHTLYVVLLSWAYSVGELSLVFPVSRGAGIVFTCFGSYFLSIDSLSSTGLIGIFLIVVGIMSLGFAKTTVDRKVKSIGAALCVSVCVSSYTLLDKAGVGEMPVLLYLGAINLIPALIILPWYVFKKSSDLQTVFRDHKLEAGVIGIGGALGYAIILFAFQLSPAAYVAALRELSIVFVVFMGVVFLKEKLSKRKIIGALFVVLGAVVLRLA